MEKQYPDLTQEDLRGDLYPVYKMYTNKWLLINKEDFWETKLGYICYNGDDATQAIHIFRKRPDKHLYQLIFYEGG